MRWGPQRRTAACTTPALDCRPCRGGSPTRKALASAAVVVFLPDGSSVAATVAGAAAGASRGPSGAIAIEVVLHVQGAAEAAVTNPCCSRGCSYLPPRRRPPGAPAPAPGSSPWGTVAPASRGANIPATSLPTTPSLPPPPFPTASPPPPTGPRGAQLCSATPLAPVSSGSGLASTPPAPPSPRQPCRVPLHLPRSVSGGSEGVACRRQRRLWALNLHPGPRGGGGDKFSCGGVGGGRRPHV